jgi:hypothetical protein
VGKATGGGQGRSADGESASACAPQLLHGVQLGAVLAAAAVATATRRTLPVCGLTSAVKIEVPPLPLAAALAISDSTTYM